MKASSPIVHHVLPPVIADGAKKNCPVSKVLAAAEITLDAKLV